MSTSRTVVIGAGMVGVSIAWHLRERGRDVVLVDRREPGRETSYGNAGLIQREAVKPHPFPRQVGEILRVLPNLSIDVRYRWAAMFEQASTLWKFWRYSASKPFDAIIAEYASLIEHCTADHQTMITASNAEHLVQREGWLQVYRTMKRFEADLLEAAEFHDRFGVMFQRLDRAALHAMEPYLSEQAIGAIHWRNAWAVTDPGALVLAYVDSFVARGGELRQAEVASLQQAGAHWIIQSDKGTLEADEVVLATGPWSPTWLRQLGYRIPMFVQRGYHMHYGSKDGAELNHSVMDMEKGYVFGPKQAGLRLTTGAELNTINAPPRLGQLAAAEDALRGLYPLGERKEEKPWKGARPCLADMKPLIGPAHRHQNLWFAFGHGHQGFTLGPTTGRLLGQLMDGETPAVDMAPFRSDRF